ncbi:MAG: hypothetical protein LBI71_11915 [Enterobacteriaceae bacterium]|jgi:type 1 fimbria pilin|nr:hypothetical protein [Enterobacteriaceae bacterium]
MNQWRLWCWMGMAFGLLPAAALSADNPTRSDKAELLVRTEIISGSCDLNVAQPTITFGNYLPGDFNKNNNWTVAIQPIELSLGKCTGNGGILKPAILVSGDTLPDNPAMFASPDAADNSASDKNKNISANSGFMLREGEYKGPLNGFFAPNAPEIITNGKYTYVGQKSERWEIGKKFIYTVGYVSNNKEPGVGLTQANVTFSFQYH